MTLDLTPDQLLSTTRTVRKRLDLSRPVERELLEECFDLALQAPTGGNQQGWHFVVVTDADHKKALAELYRKSQSETEPPSAPAGQEAVMKSAAYLAEHLQEVPVLVIPCIEGRYENAPHLWQPSRGDRYCPRPGVSCSPPAPGAWEQHGRHCTWPTNATLPQCSGSRMSR
jgi:nitroreductase